MPNDTHANYRTAVARKNPPSNVPSGASFSFAAAPPTPSQPPAQPGGAWQTTQFKRAIAGAYRNAITKQVSDDLHDVILGWLSPEDRDKPHLALNLDHANYNKWVKEGALNLRMLTQTLVQQAKDFTDLVFPNNSLIVGPERAELLKIDGSGAALKEGYRRLRDRVVELSDDQTEILLWVYRYSEDRNLTGLAYSWILNSPADDSVEEKKAARWIRARLGSEAEKALKLLVDDWADVCVQVCRVLEEHTGL